MKTRRLICWVGCLVLLSVSGCRHKAPPPPPPAATAPPVAPPPITVITPLPSVPTQTSPTVTKAEPAPPVTTATVQPPRHKRRNRRKAAEAAKTADTSTATGVAPQPTQGTPTQKAPSSTPSPSERASVEVPALGELSTGTAISSRERTRLLDEIAVQETRLKKEKTPAGADAQAVLVQVQAFLAKARQAVADNDLDGASTLNTKARVLLDELQTQ